MTSFVSSNPPSAISLVMASASPRGIGLDSEMGRKTRCKSRRMQLCSLGSIPGRTGAIPIVLSM